MNHALKQLANCSLLQRKEMRGYVMPTTSAQPTNHVLKDPEAQLRDERESGAMKLFNFFLQAALLSWIFTGVGNSLEEGSTSINPN